MSNTPNPYEPPQSTEAEVVGVNSGRIEDLRLVAGFQKGVIWCILGYFCAIVSWTAAPFEVLPLVVAVAVLILGAVFVFLLSLKVYPTGLGIVLGIATVIPMVGLISLLLVNGKATAILKANGYTVGLLGANRSYIQHPQPRGQHPHDRHPPHVGS